MGLFKSAEAKPVEVLGNPMKCEICGHDRSFQGEGKIQTTGMTFLELDFLNPSTDCVVCEQCGFVHWFLPTR